MATNPSTVAVAQAAQQIALQMLEERGRGAVLVGVARVDAAPGVPWRQGGPGQPSGAD